MYKFDEGGYLAKFKARICVRGDLQPVSEEETRAATLVFKVFRALMAMTAKYGLEAQQLDAINAFCNAMLPTPVYTQMPEGFEIPGMSLELQRALYGLRCSPLLWLQEFSRLLTKLGLTQIPGEPCLFTDHQGIIVFFYVDDIVVLFKKERQEDANDLIKKIGKAYEMRFISELLWFLGV